MGDIACPKCTETRYCDQCAAMASVRAMNNIFNSMAKALKPKDTNARVI